jgi:hypothetical protein
MAIRSRTFRWSAAIAAVQLLAAIQAHAQDIPMGETAFTAFMAQRIRNAVTVRVEIKGPLTLAIGSAQANLDRIYAFCKANANGCAKEVDTYMDGVAQVMRNQSEPAARDALRVVIRPTGYVQQAAGQFGADATIPPRALVKGLVIVPVLDSSRTVRVLNGKDLATLGLSAGQASDIGMANLRRSMKPLMEVANPMGSGRIGHFEGDYYQSSRLALVDTWAPLAQAQGGVLIVAVPSADTVLYVGEDSAGAIDALRTFAAHVMSRAPKPLSGTLLRWTPKGWQLVP